MSEQNPWESNEKTAVASPEPAAQVRVQRGALDIQPQRILAVWPFMVIFGALSLFLAWAYLRYEVNIYEVQTSVVLEDNAESKNPLDAIYSTKDPLNNQIALLKSATVAKRVVDKLHIQYHAIVPGQFKSKELFTQMKWWVVNPSENRRGNLRLELKPDANGFTWMNGKKSGRGRWGETVLIEGDSVHFELRSSSLPGALIHLYESDAWSEANRISSSLVVGSRKESNVVSVTMQDAVPERAIAILSELVPAYETEAKISKSTSLQQSLKFIQDRLIPVTEELDSIEAGITRFKSAIGYSGQPTNGSLQTSTQIQQFEDRLQELDMMQARLEAAEKQLAVSGNSAELMLTAVADPFLQNKLDLYNRLQQEHKKIARTLTFKNPRFAESERMMNEARVRLNEAIKVQKSNLQQQRSITRNRLGVIRSNLSRMPELEKELEQQTRMRNIKQKLYDLLLQNREEVSIKLASVSVNTSVLAPPKMPSEPISPKRKEIMALAMLIGLLLPLVVVVIRELINNRIVSKKQLQQMTAVPVLSEIDQAKKELEGIVVGEKDRSIIGEQFRTLRTNLGFYGKPGKPLFVVVSSSMSGEGKSFISVNLAASFALLGKKVALLEFDLRKPKLRQRMGLSTGKGIVNVLLGEVTPDTIVSPIMEGYHLDLLASGPIPPNPSELMAMQGMQVLKQYLDEHYDVIIIDTPPFGLVTDAQLLDQWADVSLIVVRFMNTLREQVVEIEEARQRRTFSRMALIFNGIRSSGYYGYRYGYYGSKRKYGYGYYAKDI